MDAVHTLPTNASPIERVLFRRGRQHAGAGWSLDKMRDYSDDILNNHGFTHYDAYWTGVDSILEG